MKTIKINGQFKKDLKRYKHQTSKIDALEVVLNKLKNEEDYEDPQIHLCDNAVTKPLIYKIFN